jgi:16S rRNA (adenine1518-N6/adenine1519-N6)-dimethyltransferase
LLKAFPPGKFPAMDSSPKKKPDSGVHGNREEAKPHDQVSQSPLDSADSGALSSDQLEDALKGLRPAAASASSKDDPRDRLASPIGYVRKHGGLPATRKSLGQNWLTDSNAVRSIVESLEAERGDLVVEIGPGTGALTEQLLANGYRVIALEIDGRMIDHLAKRWGDHQLLTVHHVDVMKTEIATLTDGEPFVLIGNLPYNITSSLLFKLLEEFRTYPAIITRIVVLLQYEVALRLIAQPGASEASILSLLLRFWGEPELALKVPKEVFHPRPKVDAGLLAMDVYSQPLHSVEHWPTLMKLVKGTFSKRRKMLRNSLPDISGIRPIDEIEFDWTRRPQTLSAAEYAWLAEQLTPNRER